MKKETLIKLLETDKAIETKIQELRNLGLYFDWLDYVTTNIEDAILNELGIPEGCEMVIEGLQEVLYNYSKNNLSLDETINKLINWKELLR